MTDPGTGADWNGWGGGVANTRFQPADKGGLTAPLVPKLKLKWAFGFPGVTSARAQPAVAGGRLFVASENGDVFALDAKTGCTYWTFHAQAGVRTAISVGPYKTRRRARRGTRSTSRDGERERLRRRRRHAASRSGRARSTIIP